MYIKGVKGGKDRGEVIELTPPEKIPHALQEALAHGRPGQDENFQDFLVSVDKKSLKTNKFNYSAKGDPLKKKWQNNTYSVDGEAAIGLLHKATNQAHQSRQIRFRLRFEDSLTRNGQPDLKVTHFEIVT